jgi:hypothetical protein
MSVLASSGITVVLLASHGQIGDNPIALIEWITVEFVCFELGWVIALDTIVYKQRRPVMHQKTYCNVDTQALAAPGVSAQRK